MDPLEIKKALESLSGIERLSAKAIQGLAPVIQPIQGIGGGGGGFGVSDEGIQVTFRPQDLDFAGAGVSVTQAPNGVLITIPGGGAATMAIGSIVTGGTVGSVLFIGPGPVLAQDNPNFFWDDTNKFLGIGTNTPAFTLDVVGNASITGKLTVGGSIDPTDIILFDGGNASFIEWGDGQSAAVSAGSTGRIRYNSISQTFQVSENGGAYVDLSTGGSVTGTGAAGQVAFWDAVSNITGDNQLFWNNTNKSLSIGSTNDTFTLFGSLMFPFALSTHRDDSYSNLSFWLESVGTTQPAVLMTKPNGSLGSETTNVDGDILGSIVWSGYDGSIYGITATIEAQIDGTVGLIDIPGRLVFSTCPAGSTSVFERMRIDNIGQVGINTTTPTQMLDVRGSINVGSAGDSTAWIYKEESPFIYTPASGTLFVGEAVGNTSALGFNFGFGFNVMSGINTGTNNVGIGSASLNSLFDGNNNIAVGNQGLQALTDGSRNIAFGALSLNVTITDDDNIAIGHSALTAVNGQSGNIAIGTNAGATLSSGTGNNVFIGYGADSTVASVVNSIAIGANAFVSDSQTIVLGDPSLNMRLVIGDTVAPSGIKVYISHSSDLQFRLDSPNNTANQISFSRGTGISYFGPSDTNEFHIFGGVTSAPAPLDIVIFPGSSEVARFIGSTTETLRFVGDQAATVLINRNANTSINGTILTVQAGGAASGATNKEGGPLYLKSGIATGTGDSEIEFYTAKAGATGTTDNYPNLRAVLNGDGKFTINSGKAAVGNQVAVGGVSHVDTTPVTTTGAAEEDLMTYSLPASTLGTNGDSLDIDAWGTFAATAGAKTIRVYFGATSVSLASGAGSSGTWRVKARIIRTGDTTQIMQADMLGDFGSFSNPVTIGSASPAETLSGAVTVKLTGTGGAAADITQDAFIIKWNPNN
jgi:hypothetical protein